MYSWGLTPEAEAFRVRYGIAGYLLAGGVSEALATYESSKEQPKQNHPSVPRMLKAVLVFGSRVIASVWSDA